MAGHQRQRGVAPAPPPGAMAPAFRAGQRVTINGLRGCTLLNGKSGTLLEYDGAEEQWNVWLEDGYGKRFRKANLVPCSSAAPQMSDAALATELQADSWARCSGFCQDTALNGQLCRLLQYIEQEDCWRVVMNDGIGRTIRRTCLQPLGPGESAGQPCMFPTSHPDARMAPPPPGTSAGVSSASEVSQGEVPGAGIDAREQMAGMRVKIIGLTRRPDMNGLFGTLIEYRPSDPRWLVKLDDGSSKLLKGVNLVAVGWGGCCWQEEGAAASSAQQVQVDSSTHASSSMVTLDAGPGNAAGGLQRQHWQIPMEDVDLAPGCKAIVCGIQSRQDFNGQMVNVLEFSEDEGMWRVQMEDGSERHFRSLNLEPSPEESYEATAQALDDVVAVPEPKRLDWERLISKGSCSSLAAAPAPALGCGDIAVPTGVFDPAAGLSVKRCTELCAAKCVELWRQVLPVCDENCFESLFDALASSSVFAHAFVGPQRGPFVLPSVPCVASALPLADLATGLASACFDGQAYPCETALTLTDGDRFKCPVGLPPIESVADVEAILEYGTLFLNAASMHWKPLAHICLAASQALQFPVNINIYATGQGRKVSTDVHTDNHDVFVLQTDGAKHWRIYPPPRRRPGPRPLYRGKDEDKLYFDELEDPIIECNLLPGQVLFIPMGFPHATDTMGIPPGTGTSVHLTLGISANDWDFSYLGLRKDVLSQLGMDHYLDEASISDDAFWGLYSALPVGALAPASAKSTLEAGNGESAKTLLAQHIGCELCRLLELAEPTRFFASARDAQHVRSLAAGMAAVRLGLLMEALELQEEAYTEVLAARGDKLVRLPTGSIGASISPYRQMMVRPDVGKCRSGTREMSPKRLDPVDGHLRSVRELKKVYGHEYSHQEIERYWEDECKSVFPNDRPPIDLMEEIEIASRSCGAFIRYLHKRMQHLHTSSSQSLETPTVLQAANKDLRCQEERMSDDSWFAGPPPRNLIEVAQPDPVIKEHWELCD